MDFSFIKGSEGHYDWVGLLWKYFLGELDEPSLHPVDSLVLKLRENLERSNRKAIHSLK